MNEGSYEQMPDLPGHEETGILGEGLHWHQKS